MKRNFYSHIKSDLQLWCYTGQGSPFAVTLNVRKLCTFCVFFLALMFVFFIGSLLFFRELDISRKFEQRVLELEIERTLAQNKKVLPSVQTTADVKKDVSLEVSAEIPKEKRFASTGARMSGMTVRCSLGLCRVNVGLVPTGAGSAQGTLIVILETEVKRIGPATHTTGARKRFIVYPGYVGRETVNRSLVSEWKGKPFKFSTALQSKIKFTLDQNLVPLSVEAYVFDNKKALLQHKRIPVLQ